MIKIQFVHGRITVEGHAGYAQPGKDIVCAGVTALTQTLIRSIEGLTEDKMEYTVSPGMVDIEYGDLSEWSKVLIDSFFIGISMIADEFPDNVCIV